MGQIPVHLLMSLDSTRIIKGNPMVDRLIHFTFSVHHSWGLPIQATMDRVIEAGKVKKPPQKSVKWPSTLRPGSRCLSG
jgi:hypothetical protein